MNDSLCIICFSPFDNGQIRYTCVRKDCNEVICQECLFSLITYSEESNILPKCPSDKCKGIYTLSDIKGIPKDYIKLYESACFKFIMKDQGDNVKRRIQEKKVLSDIRDDRLKYLEKEYPKAISLVAKIAFKNKLRALDKQKSKLISAQINKANRSCINIACNGYLDRNFICMTCETEFCGNCERKINNNHKCKQEDIDSINIIKNMIKCPGCNLPVFKNEGCDSITCSNCSTNFKYSTGQVGGHGSYNAKLPSIIKIGTKEKLSNIFDDKLDKECLGLLLKLESFTPAAKSKEIILTPLKSYFIEPNATIASKISLKIDEYYNYMARHRQVNNYLNKFEEMILHNEDMSILKKYLNDTITQLNK